MSMQTYSYTSVQSTSTKLHAMPSIKRRAHRRSPSSSESSNDTPQTQVKLLVVDRSTVSTKMNSVTVKYKIPPIRIPAMQIRVPPHKDWYTIKPIPRAPLPLYHPLRVVKPKPAPPMSTALPLTRRIDEKKEATPEPRPSRQRRPPLRLRELGATVGTGSGPNSPTSELGVESPKPKRQRRTKAETAAAAAAADGESNAAGGQALRSSKRKRSGSGKDAGAVEEVSGDIVGSGSGSAGTGTTSLSERPVKRRRQSKSNEVTSNYGTRSRTIVKRSKRTSSGSDISGSEDANNNEIEEEEDVQVQNHEEVPTTVMDEPAMEMPRETTAEVVAPLQPTIIEDEVLTGASS